MSNRLKILYVVNTLRQTSSPLHEHVLPISENHDVTVCSYGSIQCDLPNRVRYSSGGGSITGFISSLAKCLKSEQFDIIHLHAPHSASIALFSLMFRNLAGHSKTVYTVHNSISRYNPLHLLLLLFIFIRVDKIVHCSQSSYDSFSEKIRSLFKSRRVAIPNGVNLDFVDKVLSEKEATDLVHTDQTDLKTRGAHKLITIGRLVTVKNHSLLLQALAKINHSSFELQIIGTGPMLSQLENEASTLGIREKVEFTGAIPREDVYRRLNTSDLYVSTSTLEGLPLSVLEALACGCPVILSDIPSHKEVLDENGIVTIVNQNVETAYVEKIDHYLALSESAKESIRKQGREHVEKNHSMRKMNEGYLAMYRDLLN